ncbi:ATP synthase F0 subcomplex B subunit [Pseudomonas antarctica]|uniref:ATP synthase subunit b n=1 Tax=Pseudomonas antarctica TaxID=219572 RepID=A0A1H0BU61_9PSED|nr:F0F1 ATP synthase subunit delta [Pseudomonas antarctica]KAF2406645.1 ATP synthase subunit b [Pseudomonas antarctica]SDN49135.1 ATP synthase F0 subcomplex B subunit [Pseudomonas antarctica]
MLIDWFTVAAQVLNFLILVWLMKRFLYQPVLNAIAAREAKIAAELNDAAQTKAMAHQQQDEFESKNKAFDEQRAALLNKATAEANDERLRLLDEARKSAEAARALSAKNLLAQSQDLHASLVRQTQQQVYDISRRVLSDLASVGLEQRACEVFIQRLQAFDGPARDELADALQATREDEPARLRSAFELPAAQRGLVQAALDEWSGQAIVLTFETAPELVSGIEVSVQGLTLAWSIADYLSALSSDVCEPPRATERS